jgi:hypothetical protein
MYSRRNTEMNLYSFEQDAWHFVLRPEVGAILQITPGYSIGVSAKYLYGFQAGDLPAQGYFTLNVGFVIPGDY